MVATGTNTPNQDHALQVIKKYRNYVGVIVEPNIPDESKLKAAQEISENFEVIIVSPHYSTFLEFAIPRFLQFLRDGKPQFVAEGLVQQLRKLILEIIHRIPTNDHLRPHYKSILTTMFHLLELENEENVLVCLRIIIELHRQFRPPMQSEIQHFLHFVKNIYKELPNNIKSSFDVVHITPTGYLPAEVNGGSAATTSTPGNSALTTTTQATKSSGDLNTTAKTGQQQTAIPKAVTSLKVLAELPIIVVLLFQLYKQNVLGEIREFIPLIMKTIVLQPSTQARSASTFNKEIYVDFVAAQIKTLSFLAFIIRAYQEYVNNFSPNMVGGMLGLFRYCPQEVAHLRKELLIAARHILVTDLRNRFVPHIDQLFDEDVLIGSGWTARESLRPLAYSTLADLVHHVRTHLPLHHLSLAVHLFSKNVHDESLPVSIQTMSCKLLLNLVEGIRKSDEQGAGREILMRMLEVFIRKFHSIAKHELPHIMAKCENKGETSSTKEQPAAESSSQNQTKPSLSSLIQESESSSSKKPGESKITTFSAADCKSMVKTLVCGVKTITWGAGSCRDVGAAIQAPQSEKVFLPQETPSFSRLLKYALQALDIYQILSAPNGTYYIRTPNSQQVRMKEEKEILEHFAGVFTMLNTSTFKEVFQENIEYLVERIHANFALQIIPNSFLANPHTSATFATILMQFLLNKLGEMGTNVESSNLYLKLFKLVFGSVSLFASENEQMLKPHLHEVVNRSMELACTSKEPYNYFLLLRALFRSIGGGNHDLLYQEFLPLLPNLLQGLNNLQSGVHRQYMKDLFVELCLTVPVRLSSLLPYLPMLMDPLVSALNGSQTLVSQGLRTLELCVDNLQPDFLYDHIQPVRAELFQALWKTLRNQSDSIAHVAFRVLGKFGGGNRRMLKEPQKLKYDDMGSIGPCISIYFPESNTPVTLPVSSVIESALAVLKAAPATAPATVQQQSPSSPEAENTSFYRKQAWLVIQSFLVTMISFEDSAVVLELLLSHPSFKTGTPPITGKTALPAAVDKATKQTLKNALLGMLVASSVADIKSDVIPFMCNIVRHYTILCVAQQAGPCASKPSSSPQGADVHVLIDAISSVMVLEEKELCTTGELAIAVMRETSCIIMGDLYKALQLPLFEYLVEKLCGCCYERAWFAKAGGCSSISFLMKIMPLKWIIEHQLSFVYAIMFVMMDLTNEVSAGTVDLSKEILEKLIRQCNTQVEKDEEITAVQKRCLPTLVQHLVREVISANDVVREQAQFSLSVLSDITGKSVHDIMEPHKSLLEDMMPPKKVLLRHQPVNMQIALMDGNTFCTTLKPRLFTMDLNVIEHKVFFKELLFLCETEDAQLQRLPCYKLVQNFTALRTKALHALAAYHYISQVRDTIFNSLYKTLKSNIVDVQKAGNEALKKFLAGGPTMETDTVQQAIRPLFLKLGDHRILNLQIIKRLSFLMELFPQLFNEKLCEQLLTHLKNLVEACVTTANQTQQGAKPARKMEDVIDICTAIMNIFHLMPAASAKLIEPLIQMVLKVEKALLTSSSFRKPLLQFLIRFSSQTVDYFLLHISDSHISRLFVYFLRQQDVKALRGAIEANPLKLVNSTFLGTQSQAEEQAASFQNKLELQFQGILIVRLLVKFNDDWLSHHRVLVGHLKRIWTSESFQDSIKKDGVPVHRWREPKLLVKCLLNYVKHRPSEVELLFQLLRVFTHRHIPDFQFLKTFMEEDVAKKYTVEQKRAVFFQFVEIVHDENFPQDLTAKALQYIIIPMFVASFEKGETDNIIGGPPNPEQDSGENVISVFVSKVIDPENPFKTSDAVRILLLQFSALLFEHASQHIHDAANKKQGTKLRRMMTFAWPCLLPNKQCVDPATKYHGHLLLAHIISKFAIHKRIVIQVFHSLLKAHAAEARSVVRQALGILTPAVPTRMEDGYAMLTHWTKKIIVEDGHTLPQLVHMLQLLVRHYKVYYPVRGHLIQHMITAMQKLGFTSSATIEHRKLAVDLANVIIEWELQRTKGEQQESTKVKVQEEKENPSCGVKRAAEDTSHEPAKKLKTSAQGSSQKDGGQSSQHRTQVDKHHADAVINFLLKVACQVNEGSTTVGSPGEALSKRCVLLLKTALKPGFWQGTDIKLTWLDKLFVQLDQTPGTNFNNVCTGLEILTYLLTVLPRVDILPLLKPLQRGIVACMTCQNNKVIRAVHSFLAKLMSLFPIESATMTAKYEELELLYTSLGKVIYEGLTNYAKSANQGATSTLQGPLMFLKAAYASSPSYIDRLINPCIRALQKMHKDHISGSPGDMLVACVDLVKSRLGAMDGEARKLFIAILAQLVEKSPDAKLLKAVTKVTEEWIKAKVTPQNQQHLPTLREKAILLCRMMPNYEKRFPEDFELHAQYLELINYVYRDDSLLATELAAKLEPAFMSGLKYIQPQIRSRFMEVFDQSISKKLYERLLYIFCSQNWEAMKSHFWIKQCIELLLAAAVCDHPLNLSSTFNKLPSLSSILKLSSKAEAKEILESVKKTLGDVKVKQEPMDIDAEQELKNCDQDNFLFTKESSEKIMSVMEDCAFPWNVQSAQSSAALTVLVKKHQEFLMQQKSVKSTPFLGALAQLCHSDTQLSHNVWVNLFPQLWSLLRDKQQQILSGELSPFMCSGTNSVQLDSHPSVVHTILESISRCKPTIPMRPSILKYLGKSHNQWHLCTLILEDYVTLCEEYVNPPLIRQQQQQLIESIYEEDASDVNPQETLDSLAEMYSLLNEEDMWAGLWLRRARYPETATAIAYETQGFFEQAQSAYELAMTKAREEHTKTAALAHVLPEYKLWEDHWIKCSQELGQWDLLMEFGKSKGSNNPFLVLESAWRVPDWPSMKEALAQVDKGFPDSILYKHDLYRAYIEICNPEDQHLKVGEVEKLVETASAQAIRLWKRLPDIISHQHVSFLQASQQIVELQEAAQIRAGIQPQHVGRNASLHDMKAIIKTWKNRLPMISDNLSHWSDIFLWRHHHYEAIIGAYDAQHDQPNHSTNHSMLGVHASAWSIIHYGQIARKQALTGVCLDSLSRIHTIPSVPIVDCFQKIRQQVKCYLQMAGTMRKQELQEGLEVIESTNLKYFSKEMTAEFYALKGTFLAQIGRSEDANKAFSQAVQMHDTLIKGWALWGDYLDTIFVKERTISLGVYAIICYMHASRNPNEVKCRKYLARTIWLLTYDDEKSSLAEALDKYCVGVPPVHWLPWVPQLLTCLIRKEGSKISNLLMQIGRVHAQAIYFPIRTLYLTLKLEHREKHKLETSSTSKGNSKPNSVSTPTTPTTPLTPSTTTTSASNTTSASVQVKNEPVQAPKATCASVDSTLISTVTKTILSLGGAVSSPSSDGGTETSTRKSVPGTKPGETTVVTTASASTTQGSLSSCQSGAEPGSMRVTAPMWLCSRIMHGLRELHPTLLAALEGIVDQMVWFRECWHEEVLRQLRQVLTKCYQVAFETRTDVSNAKITPHTMSFVKKLVSIFGVGFEFGTSVSQTFASAASESLARRAHATAQDPMFQKMKEQFTADFDFTTPNSMGLHNLIAKLKKWIKILEAKTKLLSSSFLLEERCRFLSVYSIATADVELPGEFLMPKPNMHSHYYIRIAQFMPHVELVQKHNMSARRLFIRANNGKIYPYLVVNDACLSDSRREERVLQLLRIINLYFEKRKESSKRHLLYTVPRVVAVSPQMHLIQDTPSAVTLKEVMKMHYEKNGIDEDSPVSLYYERLAAVQARGEQSTHQVLRDIFKEIQSTIVPEVVLKEWAQRSYQTSSDYWTFRKQFTAQLTLSQFAEFTLHLSRLSPEMLEIVRETGRLTVAYYKFEIDDSKGELDANRPVPFRLTPNISELISPVGIGGVLTSSMVAAARCLVDPKFSIDSILRVILRDEMIAWHKKKHDAQLHSNGQSSSEQIDNEVLINLVNGAVNSIMTRLQNLAEFEGAETKVTTLIGAAMSPDNLCRMDPAWHPWL